MKHGKCTLLDKWFLKEDRKFFLAKEWGEKQSEKEIFCLLCSSVTNVNIKKGFQAITQHGSSKKYISECTAKLAPRQLWLTVLIPAFNDKTGFKHLQC